MEEHRKVFDFSGFIIYLVKKWKVIIGSIVFVSIVSLVYILFFVNCQFSSSVTFLPPFSNQTIVPSFLSSELIGGFSSSSELQPEQIKTLFQSYALKRRVINTFNYYEKYKLTESKNKFKNAVKSLNEDLVLDVGEQGSFGMSKPISFTITSYHTSPDTCRHIAQFAFSVLDSMIREVSKEKGKRNKTFLQKQIDKNEAKLDSLQKEYQEFQIKNKAYEISEQARLSLDNYSQLKAKLISNQIRIKTLLQNHQRTYPEIVALQNQNRVLQSKLDAMEREHDNDVLIGLEKSARLMPTQVDYERKIKIQNKLLVFLAQQLQEAKLKEERNISSLKIVDPAFKPLYKTRPRRLFLLIGAVGVYTIFLFGFLFFVYLYHTYLKDTYLVHELYKMLRER